MRSDHLKPNLKLVVAFPRVIIAIHFFFFVASQCHSGSTSSTFLGGTVLEPFQTVRGRPAVVPKLGCSNEKLRSGGRWRNWISHSKPIGNGN